MRLCRLAFIIRQVLQLSQDKLLDTERVQQSDLTRSLAQEVQSFDSNLTQQLLSEQQILELMGTIQDVSDPAAEPKVTRLLENLVESNHTTVLYITAVSTNKKGTSASQGNFRAEQDPFVVRFEPRVSGHTAIVRDKFCEVSE